MSNVVYLNANSVARPPRPTRDDSMDAKAFREDIIRPALKVCGVWSRSAENLLLGTALVESGLRYLRQIGGGPAISPYQLEPSTIDDNIRYLNLYRNKDLKDKILAACYTEVFPPPESALWNLRYATLMARVKYIMIPDALPHHMDAFGMAEYHKRFYNTYLGETDPNASVVHFGFACIDS